MEKLLVYADFDWLKGVKQIGVLTYESLRGSDSYGFEYSIEWLKEYGNIFFCDDLNNYSGPQFTLPGKDLLVVYPHLTI